MTSKNYFHTGQSGEPVNGTLMCTEIPMYDHALVHSLSVYLASPLQNFHNLKISTHINLTDHASSTPFVQLSLTAGAERDFSGPDQIGKHLLPSFLHSSLSYIRNLSLQPWQRDPHMVRHLDFTEASAGGVQKAVPCLHHVKLLWRNLSIL